MELSEKKTVITHISDGFEFLGWSFQKYQETLFIKPLRRSIERIIERIREIRHKGDA